MNGNTSFFVFPTALFPPPWCSDALLFTVRRTATAIQKDRDLCWIWNVYEWALLECFDLLHVWYWKHSNKTNIVPTDPSTVPISFLKRPRCLNLMIAFTFVYLVLRSTPANNVFHLPIKQRVTCTPFLSALRTTRNLGPGLSVTDWSASGSRRHITRQLNNFPLEPWTLL